MHWSNSRYFILLSMFLLLPACTEIKSENRIADLSKNARTLAVQGNYLGAAQQYLNLITSTDQIIKKDQYRLQAIEYLIKANRIDSAELQLQQLHSTDPQVQVRQGIAYAEIKISQADTQAAAAILSQLVMTDIPAASRRRYHQLYRLVLEQLGNKIPALYQRIYVDVYLKGLAFEKNQTSIWQALQQMSNNQLQNMPTPAPQTLMGWLSLVLAVRENNNKDLMLVWQHWQAVFPKHPANINLIRTLHANGSQQTPGFNQKQVFNGTKIAVFLPKTGRFQVFADKIRDGLLAAWYDSQIDSRPQLTFYETKPDTIVNKYQQALDAGAQIAIGPLGKKAVNQLNQAYQDLPIPTLFLSPDPHLYHKKNAFQLSLSTEQEGILVADRALNDGHTKAAILAPDNKWGQQALQAFSNRFEQQGGHIVDYALYKKNYDEPIKQVIASMPDMVYIIAKPKTGRQLVPRFRYYKAGHIRLYASAHIYQGDPDPRSDQDLNGVYFADLPWVLLKKDWSPSKQTDQIPSHSINPVQTLLSDEANLLDLTPSHLYKQLVVYWQKTLYHNGQRLLALGADSYRILDYLHNPNHYPQGFSGATGLLTLDAQGLINRKLPWAKFKNGVPHLVNF